jgi:uncharacterized protein YjlB
MVGAYPQGQNWDTCRKALSEEARQQMAGLPAPHADLIEGCFGPLTDRWW